MFLITTIFLSNENEGFGINPDLLDTNLVNIVLLLGLLFVVLGNALGENLSQRQEQIIADVENAENQMSSAKQRMTEAKAQWSQVQIVIDETKNQTLKTKNNLVDAAFKQATEDVDQRVKTATSVISSREQRVYDEITEQITDLALNQVVTKLKKQLGAQEQKVLIDSRIKKLSNKK